MSARRLSAQEASFVYGECQRIPLNVGCLALLEAGPLRDEEGEPIPDPEKPGEFKRDKPREYEELAERGELDQYLVDPYPPRLERAFRAFGFAALAVGLALIVLIVYSVLFGYR